MSKKKIFKNAKKQFIIEYLRNSLNSDKIDSFRPRFANAHTILEEMYHVCSEVLKTGKVDPKYIEHVKEEAIGILSNDTLLNTKFNPLLQRIRKVVSGSHEVKYLLIFLEGELPFFRKHYLNNYIDLILDYVSEKNKSTTIDFETKENYRKVLSAFITELIYIGISLKYIKQKFSEINNAAGKSDFRKIFYNLSREKKYNIYLRAYYIHENVASFLIKTYNTPKSLLKVDYRPAPLSTLKKYFSQKIIHYKLFAKSKNIPSEDSWLYFILKNVTAKDKYGALLETKYLLQDLLNIIHTEIPEHNLQFAFSGLVYDFQDKRMYLVDYEKLVNYRTLTNSKHLESFIGKYAILRTSYQSIAAKVSSSISHLNFSLNDFNATNAYLNSWISLEVLFNNLSVDLEKKTIEAIHDYVPIISCLSYFKQMVDFITSSLYKANIDVTLKQNMGIDKEINLKQFIIKIQDQNIINKLRDELGNENEIFYRVEYLCNKLTKENLKKTLLKHKHSLSSHLQRLYRIRNDLVHNASASTNLPLYNLSFLKMLTINIQQYSTEVSEFIINNTAKYKAPDLFTIYEAAKVEYDKLIMQLDDPLWPIENIVE